MGFSPGMTTGVSSKYRVKYREGAEVSKIRQGLYLFIRATIAIETPFPFG